MWLAGIPLHIFASLRGGLNADQMLGIASTPPGTLVDAVQAAMIPLALVISICIALMYTLLRRLVNWRIAGLAAMLIALDPFYIGYSKVLHPDALLATFMMVSALAMLLYLKEGHWPILILSDLFAGFSFLSKSPSLFLIPYTGLAITSAAIVRWKCDRTITKNSSWKHMEWMVIRTALVWAGIAVIVFILLWPVIWVRPLDTLVEIYNGILYHGSDPHPNPVFFNGQTYETDPGLGFYLTTIGWKTTIITLPFVIIGIFLSMRRHRSAGSWLVWALATYVFFFFLQMGLSDYKQVAYILPVFPALDIIAGIGIVWSAEWLAKASGKAYASGAFIAVILKIQVAATLLSYPYFSADYDRLSGGTVVAQNILPLQDQGEGLEIAARYLNEILHGQDETATIFKRSAIVFQREFIGRTETNFIPRAT
ncbi:MAG: glycosyltransferase family 39 protein [Candidatus Promineifilaceae bacterium]